mgnify:CR=1 FL=1
MFDPKDHCTSENEVGYQIRIAYNKKQQVYYLTGHTSTMDSMNRIHYDQDGESLAFKSMEDAINHIRDYGKPKLNLEYTKVAK